MSRSDVCNFQVRSWRSAYINCTVFWKLLQQYLKPHVADSRDTISLNSCMKIFRRSIASSLHLSTWTDTEMLFKQVKSFCCTEPLHVGSIYYCNIYYTKVPFINMLNFSHLSALLQLKLNIFSKCLVQLIYTIIIYW